jgi:hypothetical protein
MSKSQESRVGDQCESQITDLENIQLKSIAVALIFILKKWSTVRGRGIVAYNVDPRWEDIGQSHDKLG